MKMHLVLLHKQCVPMLKLDATGAFVRRLLIAGSDESKAHNEQTVVTLEGCRIQSEISPDAEYQTHS